jgi:hypothetical protein
MRQTMQQNAQQNTQQSVQKRELTSLQIATWLPALRESVQPQAAGTRRNLGGIMFGKQAREALVHGGRKLAHERWKKHYETFLQAELACTSSVTKEEVELARMYDKGPESKETETSQEAEWKGQVVEVDEVSRDMCWQREKTITQDFLVACCDAITADKVIRILLPDENETLARDQLQIEMYIARKKSGLLVWFDDEQWKHEEIAFVDESHIWLDKVRMVCTADVGKVKSLLGKYDIEF